jgi:PPM family protein phosphatase
MIKLRSAGMTERGLVRTRNEDAFLAEDGLGLYAIADGIGGMQRGDEASELALHILRKQIKDSPIPSADLTAVVRNISAQVYHRGRKEDGSTGMGCTLTCLLLNDDYARLAHVGDSAAFLCRGHGITLLTQPHTMAQQLAGSRRLNDKRLLPEYFSHVLTRCIGQETELDVDLLDITLQHGDRFLLTTDGVTGVLRQQEIAEILADSKTPKACLQAIQKAVFANGAPDNLAAVVVDIRGDR